MSIHVEEKPGFVIFRIEDGVFIREGVREVSQKAKEFGAIGKPRFLFDFSKCEYISSEGIGSMADLWKYCLSQPNGKMAILFHPDPENDVHYLFESVGLAQIMKGSTFTDETLAQKSFE